MAPAPKLPSPVRFLCPTSKVVRSGPTHAGLRLLCQPDNLPALLENRADRLSAREFLAAGVSVELAQHSREPFLRLMQGVTDFCILGLHRYPEIGLPPNMRTGLTEIEQVFAYARDLPERAMDKAFLAEACHYLEHEFEPDLAMSDRDVFRSLVQGIQNFLLVAGKR